MSKFYIYRIDAKDPKTLGQNRKRLIIVYSVLFLLTYFTINSNVLFKEHSISRLTYYIILSFLIITTLSIAFIIRRQIKNIKKIGTLEFTKTTIRKEIGDLKTEFPIDKIKRIEVDKHLRALTVFGSKTGSLTYIIKILQFDFKEDQFVVSDKPADSKQKLSIIDTLNTLKNITNLDIKINKN